MSNPENDVLIVTSENIPGYKVKKVLGPVFGVAVRSRNVVGNLLGSIRSIFGGSQEGFAKMISDTREQALINLSANAKAMSANAVIMSRFDSSEFDSGQGGSMNEVTAYGTAVVIEKA